MAAPRAIIVGSGFGGLAAGVRLAARGYRVTVCEQLESAGGRAHSFTKQGFVFDAGPTIITAPFLLEELWRLCGERLADHVELRPLYPFYRIRFDDGGILDCSSDEAAMARQIREFAPADLRGYEEFLAMSREICKVAFEQLSDQPFDSFGDMLKLTPALLRLKAYRSVYSLVASYVSHPKLRFALSFHPLFIGGNPFTTPSIYGLIADLERRWGVHYAVGGMGRLVQGLVRLIGSRGGEVRFNARVQAITTAGDRVSGVTLEGGEHLAADVVVSNADTAATYARLLPPHRRHRWTDARLARAQYSMSLFVWYFGTRRQYPDVPHHTILVGPRYRELLDDIFERKVLAEDFSLYLHRPSASDPSLAPPGADTFYVLSPVPHLAAGVDWVREAPRYGAAISRFLEKTLLPGLSGCIATSHIVTPADFEQRYGSEHGSAFGMSPTLLQSAWFRPHNRSEEVRGLYLVGAGTHPGAGIPGVLSSARVLDRVVPDATQVH